MKTFLYILAASVVPILTTVDEKLASGEPVSWLRVGIALVLNIALTYRALSDRIGNVSDRGKKP